MFQFNRASSKNSRHRQIARLREANSHSGAGHSASSPAATSWAPPRPAPARPRPSCCPSSSGCWTARGAAADPRAHSDPHARAGRADSRRHRPAGPEHRLRSATVYGGVGWRRRNARCAAGTEIIVACPGRLLDHRATRHRRLDGT